MKQFFITALLLSGIYQARADSSRLVQYEPCPISGWVCWLGDGMDFQKIDWTQDIQFDPKAATPVQDEKDPKKIDWVPTSEAVTVTEEDNLLYRNGHWLSKIDYYDNHPSEYSTYRLVATIFEWDRRPFCFLFGELASEGLDEPAGFHPHYRLEETDKATYLVISATLSGTAAATTSNYFDFRRDQPNLVRKVQSARGAPGRSVPVDSKTL